jgi:hypothetical protein
MVCQGVSRNASNEDRNIQLIRSLGRVAEMHPEVWSKIIPNLSLDRLYLAIFRLYHYTNPIH